MPTREMNDIEGEMPPRPVSSYAQLLEKISELGDPPPGHVRVFRGQDRDVGEMRPTGLRRSGIPWGLVWYEHSNLLLQTCIEPTNKEDAPENLDLWHVWLQALAQHYGPGSTFLDVTHSVEVGLWFALHRATIECKFATPESQTRLEEIVDYLTPDEATREQELMTARIVKQNDQTIELFSDRVRLKRAVPMAEFYVSYRPLREEPGYLFVFDVPEWTGQDQIAHGHLIDLVGGPRFLVSSRRMAVQEACLVLAVRDVNNNNGDLSRFYACKPIPVKWPPDGPEILFASTEAMFPRPSTDSWYERFLSLPFVIQPRIPHDPTASALIFARPLPVAVYLPDEPLHSEDIERCNTVMNPPLVVSDPQAWSLELPENVATWLRGDSLRSAAFRLNAASLILLEGPLMSSVPDAQSTWWNQGILAGEMSDQLEVYLYHGTAEPRAVTLENVLFEFSPLELAGWGRKDEPESRSVLWRALWLTRRNARFVAYSFYHSPARLNVAVAKAALYVDGPVLLEFDSKSNRFRYRAPGWAEWENVTGRRQLDTPLFLSLAVIRALSPVNKADPFPVSCSVAENGNSSFEFRVTWASAGLQEAAILPGGLSLFVLTDAMRMSTRKGGMLTNEPFSFSREVTLQTARIESRVPWSEIDSESIRQLIPVK